MDEFEINGLVSVDELDWNKQDETPTIHATGQSTPIYPTMSDFLWVRARILNGISLNMEDFRPIHPMPPFQKRRIQL